ncbi:hypothetical protein G7Y29_07660 [Corynebacterium qintianiae]|uniref:Uncharacterized protein n=1 Tax=Corynebacterium qintianiae TaxID=2709392 RepID=A0A7T0KL43_9CORY|nr:hypothetical protein [Corynebacterium qintianiae]QPK82748.1 hypothetical protein G7Y29_07660 [Corynebacterium qintianiae]
MSTYLTESDESLLNASLTALESAGVCLVGDVELDDVEDAIVDDIAAFRARPLTTLAALRDPEEAPLFTRVWCDACVEPRSTLESLEECAAELCAIAGTELREFTVFPDPDSDTTGSVRLRVGEWDVADMGYDLSTEGAELDFLSATVPAGITAVTFEHDELDAHSVTLFLSSGDAAVELVDALEAELS